MVSGFPDVRAGKQRLVLAEVIPGFPLSAATGYIPKTMDVTTPVTAENLSLRLPPPG